MDSYYISPEECRNRIDSEKWRNAVQLTDALVVRFAQRYRQRNLDDLYGEAYLGLTRALNKFNPNANVKFTTYVQWWVVGQLSRWLSREIRSDQMSAFSLDEPFGWDRASPSSRQETFACAGDELLDVASIDRLLANEILASLSEREQEVLRLRYLSQLTFPEVAVALQCSVNHVKHVHRLALRRARQRLQRLGLLDGGEFPAPALQPRSSRTGRPGAPRIGIEELRRMTEQLQQMPARWSA